MSEKGGFTVLMPGNPKQSKKTQPTAVGNIDLYMFLVDKGDKAYFLCYSDYPKDMIENSDPNLILENGLKGAVNNIEGTLIKKENITLDGCPGFEIAADGKKRGKLFELKARFFLKENRLYQVVVLAEKGKETTKMDDFIKSFKFIK
jgi:hypothetical protein